MLVLRINTVSFFWAETIGKCVLSHAFGGTQCVVRCFMFVPEMWLAVSISYHFYWFNWKRKGGRYSNTRNNPTMVLHCTLSKRLGSQTHTYINSRTHTCTHVYTGNKCSCDQTPKHTLIRWKLSALNKHKW